MHWRGHSTDMQTRAVYGDVVKDVSEELQARFDAACAAGVAEDQVILDPGPRASPRTPTTTGRCWPISRS